MQANVSSAGKESPCNVGDLSSIPDLGRSPGEGNGYSLQYSGLEKSMDCIAHGVAKSWTGLSNFHDHDVTMCVCASAHSVVFNSWKAYGLWPARLLCPWDSPGKNTGMDYHCLLQGIFLTHGSNLHLLTSPALAGRFITTEPPGKPKITLAESVTIFSLPNPRMYLGL